MRLWIPGRLPGMNNIVGGQARGKSGWNAYNQLKQQWHGQIQVLVNAKRVGQVGPGYFAFLFVEPTRRRDPDNIAAGGVKLLLDSLVGAEVLTGDGWNQILGFVSYWIHEPDRAGCLVHYDPEHMPSKDQMLVELEKEIGDAKQKSRF